MSGASLIGAALWGALALLILGLLVTFHRERERRAVALTLGLGLPVLALLALPLWLPVPGREVLLPALGGLAVLLLLVVTLPLRRPSALRVVGDPERIDERDAVFHRFYRLTAGTPEFEAYYAAHPELREFDDAVRALPALGAPGSRTYHPQVSPFQVAAFQAMEAINQDLDLPPAPLEGTPVPVSPADLARRVKGFARYLGADEVGCAVLDPAHVYSHIGRSPGDWGAAIDLPHTHAIAVGVAMEHEMVRHAPDSATTTDTAHKYFAVGTVAVILARYLQTLGHAARAHVDGNYRVLCVPVAVDAGLGELGRLGLLITPRHGPRIRLAVVTTDVPLAADPPRTFGVQEFCALCKKCADCCPSASIDKGAKQVRNGSERWQTVRDTCYRFWRQQGSDCGVCLKVCPYSHPHGPAHQAVRWAIQRNPLARRLALWGDDLLYGRRRRSVVSLPDWHAQD